MCFWGYIIPGLARPAPGILPECGGPPRCPASIQCPGSSLLTDLLDDAALAGGTTKARLSTREILFFTCALRRLFSAIFLTKFCPKSAQNRFQLLAQSFRQPHALNGVHFLHFAFPNRLHFVSQNSLPNLPSTALPPAHTPRSSLRLSPPPSSRLSTTQAAGGFVPLIVLGCLVTARRDTKKPMSI